MGCMKGCAILLLAPLFGALVGVLVLPFMKKIPPHPTRKPGKIKRAMAYFVAGWVFKQVLSMSKRSGAGHQH